MNICLSLKTVDALVDLALSNTPEVSYERCKFDDPPRIIYEFSFKNIYGKSWKISIYNLESNSTEISFPIFIPNFTFLKPSTSLGGTLEILENQRLPIHDDPIEKALYDLCKSIWKKIKLHKSNNENSKSVDASEKYEQSLPFEEKSMVNETIINTKNKIKIGQDRRKGKSGRPNLPADIWAWEQINKQNRILAEVYQEWIAREDVIARNLIDPKRQFSRITQVQWGTKSRQYN